MLNKPIHTAVDGNKPSLRYFKAWVDERFPLSHSIVFFLFYCSAAAVARAAQGVIYITTGDLAACLVVWCYFLLLRVLDEHKDYQDDLKAHPGRVLQQGLISLGQLKWVGVLCAILTLLWSLFVDQGISTATLAWLLMIIWTVLMTMEFFCRRWLSSHLLVYAVSHMLVMPLFAWWCVQLASPGHVIGPTTALLAGLFFLGGFAFEITRKARGAEEERELVASYSKILGNKGAAGLIFILTLGMTVTNFGLIHLLLDDWSWQVLLFPALVFVLTIISLLRYMHQPTAKARKQNEASVGLLSIVTYCSVVGAAVIGT